MHEFWDISAANVITWLILVIGFVTAQYLALKLLGQRRDGFDEWKKFHEVDAREKVRMINRLELVTEKLTVLATAAERRLQRLEDR